MRSEEKTGQDQRKKRPQKPVSNTKRPKATKTKRPVAPKTGATKRRSASVTERRKKASRPVNVTANRRRNTERRHRRTMDQPRSGVPHQREPLPEVVYIPPKQFNRNRFVLQLASLVAVVLALTFVFSIFFKVRTVTVSGNAKYDAWTVREASGIQEGEGLLSLSNAKAAGKIRTALPYVKEVRIGIKLPDTVNIEIVESSVAYAIEAIDGTWWPMTAEGKILEQTEEAAAEKVTVITGIELAVPVEDQAKAYEEVMQNAFGDTIPVSVTAEERMNVVKQILQNLEMNGVMGDVTGIDVTNPTDLQLHFGEEFRIKLGDGTRIAHKIESMQAVFRQEEYLEPGIIDVSFTDEEHPNDVIFIPFVE